MKSASAKSASTEWVASVPMVRATQRVTVASVLACKATTKVLKTLRRSITVTSNGMRLKKGVSKGMMPDLTNDELHNKH
jgi:hypothetical protein